MKNNTSTFYLKGMVLVLAAMASWQILAQDQACTIEFGYQTIDVSGNENSYLSQENMDDGLILNSLHYEKTGGLFDHCSVNASGFGGKTNGRIQVHFQKTEKWEFRLNYSRLNQFNSLPGAGQVPNEEGAYFGEYVFDRDRESMDLEMVFLPEARFSPFIGVRYTKFDGPFDSTYFVGEDEFNLNVNMEEKETEYFGGLTFKLAKFHGELEQGFRNLDGSETRTLGQGAGNGENDTTILGQNVFLDSLTGRAEWDSSSPTTRLNLTGELGEKLVLSAAFHYGDADLDSTENEILAGNLVSFHTQRYYTGSNETISSHTENPNWFGRLILNYRMNDKYSLKLGYNKQSREVTGTALVETLYLDSVIFGTNHSSDFRDELESHTNMEREEDQIQATLQAKMNANFKFWLGGAMETQSIELGPDLSEILVSSQDAENFDREITRIRAGFIFSQKSNFQLKTEFETSDANDAVVRTDYLNRDKLTVRVKTQLGKYLHLLGNAKMTDAENLESELNYTIDSNEYSLNAMLEFTAVSCSLTYGIFDLETNHTILRPESFIYEPSIHLEDGEEIGFDTTIKVKNFQFTGNFTRYENTGTYGFTLDQIYADARFKISSSLTAGLQAFLRDYSDDSLPVSDFEAKRYALIFRYSL